MVLWDAFSLHRRARHTRGLCCSSVLLVLCAVAVWWRIARSAWLGPFCGSTKLTFQTKAERALLPAPRARGGFLYSEEESEWDFMKEAIVNLCGGRAGDGLRALEWRVRDQRFLLAMREIIGVQPWLVADNQMDSRNTDQFAMFGPFERVQVKYYRSENGLLPLKTGLLDLVIINELPEMPSDPMWEGTYDDLTTSMTDEEKTSQAERLSSLIPESYRMLKITGRLVYFCSFGDDVPEGAYKYFESKGGQEDEKQGIRAVLLIPKPGVLDAPVKKKRRRRKVPLPPE